MSFRLLHPRSLTSPWCRTVFVFRGLCPRLTPFLHSSSFSSNNFFFFFFLSVAFSTDPPSSPPPPPQDPSSSPSSSFRKLMRRVPSSVFVITTGDLEGHRRGITVGSLTSVSLNPAIVSFCVQQPSRMNDLLLRSHKFCAHLLRRDQVNLAMDFSGNVREDQFATVAHTLSQDSIPLIQGTLGVLHCEVLNLIEVGDHLLWLGKVKMVEEGAKGEPLIYHGQTYRSVGDEILMRQFEERTLKFEQWTHRAHIRMAWNYIRQHGKEVATPLIREGIKKYNEKYSARISHGYNETITMFFVDLIDLGIQAAPDIEDFFHFLQLFPLLDNMRVIFEHYDKETVMSPKAKTV